MRLLDRVRFLTLLPLVRFTHRLQGPFEERLKTLSRTDPAAAKALKVLRDAAASDTTLEAEERQMISHIYEFSETLAREVMVPRVDMVCADASQGLREVIRLIKESGHSRIPVYTDSVDHIQGIVYAKDLLDLPPQEDGASAVLALARKPFFIPETKKIDDLLRDLRRNKVHIAIVVDEYGGTAGLVTLEDLLEEIVGEIQDEYDSEEPEFVQLGPDSFRVDGRMNLDDVNDLCGTSLPTESVDTIGGFIYDLLGRIPQEGETIQWEDVSFRVEEIEGQRIAKVVITKEHCEER